MARALQLARKGFGRTSPNPAVGALVVKGGRVVASGWHKKAGEPHAEVLAIEGAGKKAAGADLYVTLEPCCHTGRTPPCVDAIIGARIGRVFVGMTDPNPKVKGRGTRALKKAGIEVISGIIEDRCRQLNEPYVNYITTGKPFVTLKLATSLDGRIALSSGKSKWITGVESRAMVHKMRSVSDAVMVGVGTVLSDDPELTVRGVKGTARGPGPVKVIVDSTLRTPLSAKVFKVKGAPKGVAGQAARSVSGQGRELIIYTTSAADKRKVKWARRAGAEVVVVPMSSDGVDLRWVMDDLGRREVTSLLVEGGSAIAASLVKGKLAHKAAIFLAPRFFGGDATASLSALGVKVLGRSPRLASVTTKKVGEDILVDGYFSGGGG